MLQAIIFDMDGTLFDSETVYIDVWSKLARTFDREYTPELTKLLHGVSENEGIVFAAKYWELDIPLATIQQTLHQLNRTIIPANIPLRQGARDLLALLTDLNIRRAVATGASRSWTTLMLTTHQIHTHFEHVVTRDDTARTKPHPDIYLEALARLGLNSDACLAIEDSPNGITAAKAAGLRTIAVGHPISSREDVKHADHFVEELHQIDQTFLSLFFTKD